jgi:hypothetical protein
MPLLLLLLPLLLLATPAHAFPAWEHRREGRPVLAHRDTADRRVDDLLRLACGAGGEVSGEIPVRRIADPGPVAVVRLKAGAAEHAAPARRAEGGGRGATIRFRFDGGEAVLDALRAGNPLRVTVLRTTYTFAGAGAEEAVEAFRRACARRVSVLYWEF